LNREAFSDNFRMVKFQKIIISFSGKMALRVMIYSIAIKMRQNMQKKESWQFELAENNSDVIVARIAWLCKKKILAHWRAKTC